MMRSILIMACWLLATAPVWAGQKRFIVGFLPETALEEREAILDRQGLKAVEDLDLLSAKVVEIETPDGIDAGPAMLGGAAYSLMSDPSIYYVEEDFYYPDWLARTPMSFQQLPLPSLHSVMQRLGKFEIKDATKGELPWGIERVNAKAAWPKTKGAGVKVAIIDTGIDPTHPDLKGNYAGGYNAVDSDAKPLDDHGHGTHVAGTIGAALDGEGVAGVAPQARLYAVKVLDKNGGGNLVSIIKGIMWCAKNDMDVANMSLGAPIGTIFMRLAVKYAKSKGTTIVAAAGNTGGRVSYPGAYGDTIAVSASDAKDNLAFFSSRGKEVEFIAPGVDIKSALPGGKYGRYSGTSMASPHVAGLAALAVSRGASGLKAVRSSLKRAAKPLDGLKPEEQGGGMIDAGLLVR